jgi:hypothetical protein
VVNKCVKASTATTDDSKQQQLDADPTDPDAGLSVSN